MWLKLKKSVSDLRGSMWCYGLGGGGDKAKAGEEE